MTRYLIDSFEQMLKKDPKSRVFLRLAEEYRKAGEFDNAARVCQDGLTHHPSYLPALVCLGRCLESLNQVDEAADAFKKVLAVAPDNTHALRGLGSIYFNTGKYAEALECYETLALQEPSDEALQDRIWTIQEKLLDPGLDDPPDPLGLGDESVEDEPPIAETQPETMEPAPEPVDRAEPDLEDIEFLEEEASSPEEFNPSVSIDKIDEEFDRAIHEVDQSAPSLLDELDDDAAEDNAEEEELPSPPKEYQELDLEEGITLGLKHETKEHYEEAILIFRGLLSSHPDDGLVKEHIDRVQMALRQETRKQRKIRYLSNFLDRVKGVYHVS